MADESPEKSLSRKTCQTGLARSRTGPGWRRAMRRCRALCWATWCWSWGREAPLMRGGSLAGSKRWHRCTQTRRISRRSRNFWWSFNVACPHLMQAAAVARPALLGCFTSEGAGRGHINGGRLGAAQWAAAQRGPASCGRCLSKWRRGPQVACRGAHFLGLRVAVVAVSLLCFWRLVGGLWCNFFHLAIGVGEKHGYFDATARKAQTVEPDTGSCGGSARRHRSGRDQLGRWRCAAWRRGAGAVCSRRRRRALHPHRPARRRRISPAPAGVP